MLVNNELPTSLVHFLSIFSLDMLEELSVTTSEEIFINDNVVSISNAIRVYIVLDRSTDLTPLLLITLILTISSFYISSQ